MTETDPNPRRASLASAAIRIACLWVAAGALFKLLAGSPNDIPRSVIDMSPLDPVNTFRSAIAVELCIVILALLRPHLAWLPLVALFAVFDFVLWPLVQDGSSSCGCFGSSVTIPPIVMLSIDTVLLVSVLAMRPWSAFGQRPLKPLPLIPLFAVVIAAPWLKFKTADTGLGPLPKRPAPTVVDETTEPEATVDKATPAAVEEEVEEETTEEFVGWSLPDPLPDFHWFETDDWVDQLIYDIDLYHFLDVDLIPPDAHVVFYRQTCDHCKAHLEKLANEPLRDVPIVLVRIIENADTPENEVTRVKPAGHIPLELPALERGYGLTTPLEMDVSGAMVTHVAVVEEDEGEEGR